jgi:hypothetical protein
MSDTPQSLRLPFSLSAVKTKGLTLAIEHAPCCILSFAAGFIGLPMLTHNPVIELGFAVGGAVAGEHIGHRLFSKHTHGSGLGSAVKRYGIALAFGLASWGAHQALFHDHHPHMDAPAAAAAPQHDHHH